MSDEEKINVTKSASHSKWASVITAVIVLVKTLVDIFFN